MTRHILNLFPMADCSDLRSDYYLLEVTGLPDNVRFAENLNKLTTMVAKETQHPVSLYWRGDKHCLATTADPSAIGKTEWRLTPHVVTLKPTGKTQHLDYSRIAPEQVGLALNLVRFQIRGALNKHSELWSDIPNTFYLREPLGRSGDIDVYSGFSFHLHCLPDGRIYLSLDSTVKYVDIGSLLKYLNSGVEFKNFRLRQFL